MAVAITIGGLVFVTCVLAFLAFTSRRRAPDPDELREAFAEKLSLASTGEGAYVDASTGDVLRVRNVMTKPIENPQYTFQGIVCYTRKSADGHESHYRDIFYFSRRLREWLHWHDAEDR